MTTLRPRVLEKARNALASGSPPLGPEWAAAFLCLALFGGACGVDAAGPLLDAGAPREGAGQADSKDGGESRAHRRKGARAKRPRKVRELRSERRAERRAVIRAKHRAEARAKRRARRTVLVSRVIDGDTIEVQLKGTTDVRLIGIDTPETVHPSEPVRCFGPAASSFTKRTLEGEMVRLEYDVERTDQYGRTLAYVFSDGRLFNETLVARGYAQVTTYPPNVKYEDRFLAAETSARGGDRGFWGHCSRSQGRDGGGERTAHGGDGDKRGAGNGRCDPNYSGACLPTYPPDIDCPDAGVEGFRSTGSDPHGFDSDGDGFACE